MAAAGSRRRWRGNVNILRAFCCPRRAAWSVLPAARCPHCPDFCPSYKGARAQIAAGPRVLCFIRDIAVSKDQDTQYRVFVDCDYLSASVPIDDPHYAGTFGFFGPHKHGDGYPSVAVDLTRALQRVHGVMPTPPESVRVQILPVARGRKPGELGSAKPSRIELAFVSP